MEADQGTAVPGSARRMGGARASARDVYKRQGQTHEAAIAKIADALNQSLLPHQTTTLLLETMAGKGSEVGGTFEELAAIIAQVDLADHVGVCLDTCHVWDAGYDIAGDLEGVVEEFDRVIGLDRLRAIQMCIRDRCTARSA